MEIQRQSLLDFDRQGLEAEIFKGLGLPAFRARQLMSWIHRKRVRDFSVMTDIAAKYRLALAERYELGRPQLVTLQRAQDGTRKYLFALSDDAQVESVFIRQERRNTLCVSSQVGCAMQCAFCRSGAMGFRRNLSAAEIVGQVLAVQDELAEDRGLVEKEIANIVFMGMGEPLHNYSNVTRAVRILNDDLGQKFSSRKITVSTSGVLSAMKRFVEEEVPANLAVSLNATTDKQREELMPINRKWPLEVLLRGIRELPLKKRERITLEYVLIKDVNDTVEDLQRLPQLLQGLRVKVNLIPYNECAHLSYKSPPRERIMDWQQALLAVGVTSTIRWSKGEDISAACGQLATESLGKHHKEWLREQLA